MMKRIAVHYRTVVEACRTFLTRREQMIHEQLEALIAEEMKGYKKWWGLKQVGPFSYEEAVQRLKDEPHPGWFMLNRWCTISEKGSGWKERAEKLIRAADLAKGGNKDHPEHHFVWLDDEDIILVRGLENFFEKV